MVNFEEFLVTDSSPCPTPTSTPAITAPAATPAAKPAATPAAAPFNIFAIMNVVSTVMLVKPLSLLTQNCSGRTNQANLTVTENNTLRIADTSVPAPVSQVAVSQHTGQPLLALLLLYLVPLLMLSSGMGDWKGEL